METFYTDDLPSISTPTISTVNIPSLKDIKVPDLSAILKLPSVPGLPNLTSSIPKLDAKCGLNASIEQFNSDKKLAEDKLSSLMAGAGGITGSLGSLSSSLQNSVDGIAKSLNKNLLADAPKIGIKLQDEFHKVMDSFSSGNPSSALLKLQDIKKLFPDFNLQKALDGAAGILPIGAIPPNAAELIKGDLTKAQSDLNLAIPKFQAFGNDILSSVSKFSADAKNAVADATNSISDAQKNIGTALGSLNSGVGNNLQLSGLTNSVTNAINSTKDSLNKLGGSFAGPAGPSASLTGASDALKKLTGSLSEGIAKIPKFDICTSIPNQQVVNGEVKELPIPPVKPTVNAEPPTPPTPAPTPVVPVLADPYTFKWFTKAMNLELLDLMLPIRLAGETFGFKTKFSRDIDPDQQERKSISMKIPLDRSVPDRYWKAQEILKPAKEEWEQLDKELSLLPNQGRGTDKDDSHFATGRILRFWLTKVDIEWRVYNHRVKNNLIDKLE